MNDTVFSTNDYSFVKMDLSWGDLLSVPRGRVGYVPRKHGPSKAKKSARKAQRQARRIGRGR